MGGFNRLFFGRMGKNTGYRKVSPFADRKAIEYSINLVESAYLVQEPEGVFCYLTELLGNDCISRTFDQAAKECASPNGIETTNSQNFDYDDWKKILGRERIARIIRNGILPALTRMRAQCDASAQTDKRLNVIKTVFRLSEVEAEILSFLYAKECSPIVATLRGIDDLGGKTQFVNNIWRIIGFDRKQIQAALRKGNMIKSGVLDLDSLDSLPDWVSDYLSGLKDDLNSNFFSEFKGRALDLDAHLLGKQDVEVMKEFVARKGPANLLFYGEPGTGKTELAKSLAAHCGKRLCIINNKENENADDLKRAITATCNIVDPEKSVILVDEADGLLNTSYAYLFSGEKNDKSWINCFLDESRQKIVWIANRSDGIEPSTMRRFAFSLLFKKFTVRKKLQAFRHCLAQSGLENYFTADDLLKICGRYSVNAGGIADALRNLKIRKSSNKAKALEKLETVLRNHQTAITGRECPRGLKEMKEYSLSALNVSEDLDGVISTLEAFLERQNLSADTARSGMNLLLYGPPGSGKTEFVKYLGKALRKEIVLKRASDLKSCLVGVTEKLIAQAFDEAEGGESILFLDEADTFLYPREQATHSWEMSETNELLTQMENFKGILVCATNFLKGLDQAALRRFKFKIEFRALTGEGNLEMYRTVLLPLMKTAALSPEMEKEVKRMRGLTPGDFHVVAEKFAFADRSGLTHETLIESLQRELKLKPKQNAIGFAA